MCDRPSALIHKTTLAIVAADLDSHSGTRAALKLGDKDRNYVEIEWPERSPQVVVRDADASGEKIAEIKEYIAKRWPTREAFYKHCRERAAAAGWVYVTCEEDIADVPAIVAGRLKVEMGGKVSLPKLTKVAGYLDAPAATTLSLPKLTKVAGYLYAPAATTFNAPNLKR